MAQIRIPKDGEIGDGRLTAESAVMNRRSFLKGMATSTLVTAALVTGCTPPPDSWSRRRLTELEQRVFPAPPNPEFALPGTLTDEAVAARYNNFYEFSEVKENVHLYARDLKIRPWTVEVTGQVHQPRTFDVDTLLKTLPMEERQYRFRCVEAWAMDVPWTGFPLKLLLDQVSPLGKARYVRLTSFYRPFTAYGQLAFWYPWPYTEALTVEEAANELTLLATGIYGRPLPKQHGAPLRLVVPWKYGFKSIKSIVKIELLAHRPATFWNTVAGHEYGFTANVDPRVPHPRWSQAKEEMIDTGEVRPTLPYNGYGKQVAHLYA